MSKRKRKDHPKPKAPGPQAAGASAPTQAGAASPAAASSPKQARRPAWVWPVVFVPAVLVIGIVLWLIGRSGAPSAGGPMEGGSPVSGRIGGVTDCRAQPRFTRNLGFGRSTILSTADRATKGLIIFEPRADGPPRTYQHPSWTQAGYLGANAIDKDGHIYLAPSPRVNLIDNPPEKQNVLYRVASDTGVMTPFLALPYSRPPSLNNPYGVLGLTYDCDTHSLYASSVAGSSRREELGRLFRIDLTTGRVAAQLHNVDAIGLAIFNGAQGKRLYFGSARTQDVLSIALDAKGDFIGSPRREFSLDGIGPDGNEKARKISFERGLDMVVNGTKFSFNLAPPPAQLRPTVYRYRYDPANDRWTFLDVTTAPGGLQ